MPNMSDNNLCDINKVIHGWEQWHCRSYRVRLEQLRRNQLVPNQSKVIR